MPYITKEAREELANDLNRGIESPGELNYVLTVIVNQYVEDNGVSYQSYNDILGALEGCKLEIYRRQIAEYEDEKIKVNGDVN